MPFNPRLIPLDDPPLDEAGELQLDEQCRALSAQLVAEADSLARQLPTRQPSAPRTSRRWQGLASAALWLMIGMGMAGIVSSVYSPATPPQGVAAQKPPQASPTPFSPPRTPAVAPQTLADAFEPNAIPVNQSGGSLLLNVAPSPQEDHQAPPATDQEKIRLLEKAVERYQSAILYLQDQLLKREKERGQLEARIHALKEELRELESN